MMRRNRQRILYARSRTILVRVGLALWIIMLISGCTSIEVGDVLDIDVIDTVKAVRKVAKSFHDITPEEEYYIGRAVAATIAGQYELYPEQTANTYINILGQTLALASDRPETFGGYHFQILDSDEINAFAAPGGLIFVTRGMLRCAEHEDAVAAVLAHEIGHIQHKHGLQAIKKSRLTSSLITLLDGVDIHSEVTQLTGIFEDAIADITTTMITNGYSRSFEREADKTAVMILRRIGYDPNALVEMLTVMEQRLDPKGKDFAKTHPSPASRIKEIKKITDGYSEVITSKSRQTRFEAALGDI